MIYDIFLKGAPLLSRIQMEYDLAVFRSSFGSGKVVTILSLCLSAVLGDDPLF